jgi:hypothetical protein
VNPDSREGKGIPCLQEEEMRIVLMDESRDRSVQLTELLKKARHEVECIYSSNDFINRVMAKSTPDRILADADTWKHGKAIYNYFGIGRKLENIPVTVYNIPEGFSGISDRPKHNSDVLLHRAATLEQVAATAA